MIKFLDSINKYNEIVTWDYFKTSDGTYVGLVYYFDTNNIHKCDLFNRLDNFKRYLISENIIPKYLPEEEE